MPYGTTYNVDTLELLTSYEGYGRTLVELGTAHPEVVVLTADLSRSTRATDFFAAFPERAFNLGIAEQNMVGCAAGFAASGLVPFVINIATFQTMRSFEQIRSDFGYPRLKGIFMSIWSGLSGGYVGATHHAIEDMALMRLIPNMAVLAPANAEDTAAATHAAYDHPGPVYIRIANGMDPSGNEGNPFVLGTMAVTHEGSDATIIACGSQVADANRAARRLADDGLAVRVLYCHTVKPLDTAAVLAAARETRVIVTVEDHTTIGGLGGAVAETLADTGAATRLVRLGVPDTYAPIGYAPELYAHFGYDADGIARAVRQATSGSG
jgi:transketolase